MYMRIVWTLERKYNKNTQTQCCRMWQLVFSTLGNTQVFWWFGSPEYQVHSQLWCNMLDGMLTTCWFQSLIPFFTWEFWVMVRHQWNKKQLSMMYSLCNIYILKILQGKSAWGTCDTKSVYLNLNVLHNR